MQFGARPGICWQCVSLAEMEQIVHIWRTGKSRRSCRNHQVFAEQCTSYPRDGACPRIWRNKRPCPGDVWLLRKCMRVTPESDKKEHSWGHSREHPENLLEPYDFCRSDHACMDESDTPECDTKEHSWLEGTLESTLESTLGNIPEIFVLTFLSQYN